MNDDRNDLQQEHNSDQTSQEKSIKDDTYLKLEQCFAQNEEWKRKVNQIAADFENYKKRAVRDQMAWVESAQQKIFLDMLTVIDDFDRALHQNEHIPSQVSSWLEGFNLIRTGLQKMLRSYGIEPMTDYVAFDPLLHEAITQIKSEGKQTGTIVEVLQKGYKWRDKVLRPAKVVVAE